MEQREKLIELIGTSDVSFECFPIGDHKEEHEALADHLLANGVVVLPCRCDNCEHSIGKSLVDEQTFCLLHAGGFNNYDFCSYAKRKGGE